MTTVWDRLATLEGQTLQTLTGQEFLVQRVGPSGLGGVIVVPGSTGVPRRIWRGQFEKAVALGLLASDVTPSQLRKAEVSERHAAYVAAILRAIA